MDTHAPTTSGEKLEHQVEEGMFAPASTPIDSVSLHSGSHHPKRGRTEAQFRAHSNSPLRASSRSFSAVRESSNSGSATPEERVEGNGVAEEKRVDEKGRTIFRKVQLSSKRGTSDKKQKSPKKPSKSWITNLRRSRYKPSLVLKNSGSVARDHLASERTFLAYVRTSMGLASMGVALVQLFAIADITNRALGTDVPSTSPDVQRFARPLGAVTIAFSFLILLIGLWRYFKIQFSLPGGHFPAARVSIVFTSFVFAGIVATTFGAVLSGRKSA